MKNWTSLHSSIVQSSLMETPVSTRYVFLMFLSQSDSTGFVQGTAQSLARMFNIPLDDFRAAIEVLEGPDADSRSPEHEGRRLQKIQGGWMVLMRKKYRGNSLYGKAVSSLNGKHPQEEDSNSKRESKIHKGKDQSQSSISNTNSISEELHPSEQREYEALPTELHRKAFMLFRRWAAFSEGKGEPDFPLAQSAAAKELSCSQGHISGIVADFKARAIIEMTKEMQFKQSSARYRWAIETTLPIPVSDTDQQPDDDLPF